MIKTICPNLRQLLLLLKDGEFHSGAELGRTLAITRSGVWKLLSGLREYQIEIESHKRRGYRLRVPMELLSAEYIQHSLPAALHNDFRLIIVDSVTSTNDYLLEPSFLQTASQQTVVLAEQQTAGRGRMGRIWHSPFGVNIYCSSLWRFQREVSELAGLSLVVSLAIVAVLQKLNIAKGIQIKWPNDIMFEDRKLCGNLVEISAEFHGAVQAIIGIGLNVNQTSISPDVTLSPWSSLALIHHQLFNRNPLIAQILESLHSHLTIFQASGLQAFLEAWRVLDYLQGKPVVVSQFNQEHVGTAMGITPQGQLLVKLDETQQIQAFSTGDVSVKPRS